MRKDLVQIVCCPVHKTALKLTVEKADDHGDILEGQLRCATCKFDYPIEEGIPNLLPPEYHVDQVKAKQLKDEKPKGKVAKETPAPKPKAAKKAAKSKGAK